jgi:hypothetical protein
LRNFFRRRHALAGGDIGRIVRRDGDDPSAWSAENIANNPPVAFRGNIDAIVRLCVAAGSRFLMVLPPYPKLGRLTGNDGNTATVSPVTKAVWEHRKIAAQIASEHGQGVCDLFGKMPYPADGESFPSEFFVDRTHVNARGAAVKAKIIADTIVEQRLLNGDAGS